MDAIDLQLAQLESAGLIRQVAEQPERAYLFQHALIQEVAYESLLKADRRRLHLAATRLGGPGIPDEALGQYRLRPHRREVS